MLLELQQQVLLLGLQQVLLLEEVEKGQVKRGARQNEEMEAVGVA